MQFEARLPVVYEAWESPAQQPPETQRDWTALRNAGSWDVGGKERLGEAELQYQIHVPMPLRSPTAPGG